MEVAFNELFAAAVPDRSQLWIAPQAAHTGAFASYPAAYEQRVIAFFDAVLLENFLRPPKTSEVLETSEVFNPPLRPAAATTVRA